MKLSQLEVDYIIAKRRALKASDREVRRLSNRELVMMDVVLDADGEVISFDEFAQVMGVQQEPAANVLKPTKEEWQKWNKEYGTRTINIDLDDPFSMAKGVRQALA